MNLIEAARELVAINSVSGAEGPLAELVAGRLATAEHLSVTRVGDNVVATTNGHRHRRVVVAGHLDTVPGDPTRATVSGDRLIGLGACDMKGSLSVMLAVAREPVPRAYEVTWIFYAREETARVSNGLLELHRARPDLLVADAAILAEPTGGRVEAGCQGSLHLAITLRGARAHAARPHTGRNAIHRAGALISDVAAYEPRRPVIDGLDYAEQLQVVRIDGGVAPNVVPDEVRLALNHRVAPDRDRDTAVAALSARLGHYLDDGDSWEIEGWSPPARPNLDHPLLGELVAATGAPARAKLGWTDVALFTELGVPATNFGAGDPNLAHRAEEFVTAGELAEFDRVLRAFLA